MKNILFAAFMVAFIVCILIGMKALQVGSLALCENIYFKPNAIENMEKAGCNIKEIEERIAVVQSGKY